jgi:hypothetical protein
MKYQKPSKQDHIHDSIYILCPEKANRQKADLWLLGARGGGIMRMLMHHSSGSDKNVIEL